jgi:hypothetical protein
LTGQKVTQVASVFEERKAAGGRGKQGGVRAAARNLGISEIDAAHGPASPGRGLREETVISALI